MLCHTKKCDRSREGKEILSSCSSLPEVRQPLELSGTSRPFQTMCDNACLAITILGAHEGGAMEARKHVTSDLEQTDAWATSCQIKDGGTGVERHLEARLPMEAACKELKQG